SCAHAPRIWPLLAALRAKNKVKRGTSLSVSAGIIVLSRLQMRVDLYGFGLVPMKNTIAYSMGK
ncbi:MAG: hypothetical protein LGR52_04510, partial [Candidatus Thiosymbion ectosymbiont of Robbea hypermnestra]|nr:hypothetical protein [Candidatus Thiosymbion ectosymbiont of Robbea hypermnestra]